MVPIISSIFFKRKDAKGNPNILKSYRQCDANFVQIYKNRLVCDYFKFFKCFKI